MKIKITMYYDCFGTELGETTDLSIHRYQCEELTSNAEATEATETADSNDIIVLEIETNDPILRRLFPKAFADLLNKSHLYTHSQSETSLQSIADSVLKTLQVNQARIRGALFGLFGTSKGLNADAATIIGSYLSSEDGLRLACVSTAANKQAKLKIAQTLNTNHEITLSIEGDVPQNSEIRTLKLN